MNNVNQLIWQTLTGSDIFTAEMANRLFPLYAKENTDFPFAIYSFPDAITPSTTEGREYPVQLALFYKADNFTECCAFTDVVDGIMQAAQFLYQSTQIDYDNDYNVVIATLNYLIIKP